MNQAFAFSSYSLPPRTAVRQFVVTGTAQTRGRVQDARTGQASTSGQSDGFHQASGHRTGGARRATLSAMSSRSAGGRPMDYRNFQDHSRPHRAQHPSPQNQRRGDAGTKTEEPLGKSDPLNVAPAPEQPGEESNGPMSKLVLAAAPLGFVLGLALVLGGGFLLRDQIAVFIDYFVQLVEDWGPGGFLVYGVVYTMLEVLALPAIPLTMTAGAIFGTIPGTAVVSVASTLAAAISFLIARYLARDKVAAFAEKNPKFKAIDKAIGRNGFKVVTLLRMSPLLPLAASSYLYGLSSVDLGPYVLGSWLGMLPGTVAYVAAGTYGRMLLGAEGGGGVETWQVALGAGITFCSLLYVGRLATDAIKDEERKADAEQRELKLAEAPQDAAPAQPAAQAHVTAFDPSEDPAGIRPGLLKSPFKQDP
eukprot:jgi/Botrbrau1/3087/Bobra.0070s0073.1